MSERAPRATADAGARHSSEAGTTTRAPDPSPDRARRLQRAIRGAGITSGWLLLVVAAVVVLGYVAGVLWSVALLPVVLGLLLTTVLWPGARFLRAHRWPPALAALTVLVALLALLAGIGVLVVPPLVDQGARIAGLVSGGLEQVQRWLLGPPLQLREEQLGSVVDEAVGVLQSNVERLATGALGWLSTLGSGVVTAVLAVVLAFFFLKDGPRWLPWLAAQTGHGATPHVATLSQQGWATLSGFVRSQMLIGAVDAVFIGLGLWLLGVPLVLPIAVLTFFAAFVPIVGAIAAGAVAVLIALVSNGPTTALLALVVVLVVQQVETNVLQPVVQGQGLGLHPAVVVLAVTAGSGLVGVVGAFLAVPLAALVAVAYRYARDLLDGRSPEVAEDGSLERLVPDGGGARLVREAPAGADRDDATAAADD